MIFLLLIELRGRIGLIPTASPNFVRKHFRIHLPPLFFDSLSMINGVVLGRNSVGYASLKKRRSGWPIYFSIVSIISYYYILLSITFSLSGDIVSSLHLFLISLNIPFHKLAS